MSKLLILLFIFLGCAFMGVARDLIPKVHIPFIFSYDRNFRHVENFYRHQLKGDFDGDRCEEVLFESVYSSVDSEPIEQVEYYGDYGDLVVATCEKQPVLKLKTTGAINELKLTDHCQVFGILRIINLGEVDDYPGDEIALIVDWADFSNLSSCRIYGYQNDEWVMLKNFDIHEMTVYLAKVKRDQIADVIEQHEGGWVYQEFDAELGDVWKKLKL